MENETSEKPKWVDKNRNYRASKRRAQLDAIAQKLGFTTWVKLETAVLNGAGMEIFIAPEAYEVSYGKYYLTTTGNVGLGEVNPDDLAVIVPIPEAR